MKKYEQAESCPTARPLDTTVLTEAKDFISLEGEWDELYESCPRATPFQSWAWLYSWWEVYGGVYKLRLVTVRDGSLLVGLLPLMAWHGRLLLLGGIADAAMMTSYKDVLVKEGWEESVAEAGAKALKGMGGWWVADLRELRPEAVAWEIVRKWDGPRTTQTSAGIDNFVLIRTKPWEELLASVSKNLRKSARKTLRRLEKDGVQYEPADLEEATQAAHRLTALHREQWRGRSITPEHLTQRFERFVATAAQRATARGIGRICEFWRDGEIIASHFLVFDKDVVVAWMIGVSQEASRRYQYTTLYIWDAMNVASGRDAAYVSLTNYAIQEKLRWADEVVPSHRAILGRNSAYWIPHAGYHAMRDGYYRLISKAQLLIHSEGAPQWIRKVTHGYYALQSYVHSEGAPQWVRKATHGYYALRHEYGYRALRYKYDLAQARRETRRTKGSRPA